MGGRPTAQTENASSMIGDINKMPIKDSGEGVRSDDLCSLDCKVTECFGDNAISNEDNVVKSGDAPEMLTSDECKESTPPFAASEIADVSGLFGNDNALAGKVLEPTAPMQDCKVSDSIVSSLEEHVSNEVNAPTKIVKSL